MRWWCSPPAGESRCASSFRRSCRARSRPCAWPSSAPQRLDEGSGRGAARRAAFRRRRLPRARAADVRRPECGQVLGVGSRSASICCSPERFLSGWFSRGSFAQPRFGLFAVDEGALHLAVEVATSSRRYREEHWGAPDGLSQALAAWPSPPPPRSPRVATTTSSRACGRDAVRVDQALRPAESVRKFEISPPPGAGQGVRTDQARRNARAVPSSTWESAGTRTSWRRS